jgi:hypothetical protein
VRKNFKDLEKSSQKDPGNDLEKIPLKDNKENLRRLRKYFAARLSLLSSLTASYRSMGIDYGGGMAEETDQDEIL